MARKKYVTNRLPVQGVDMAAMHSLVLQAADVFHDASKRVMYVIEENARTLSALAEVLKAQQADTRAVLDLLRAELGK